MQIASLLYHRILGFATASAWHPYGLSAFFDAFADAQAEADAWEKELEEKGAFDIIVKLDVDDVIVVEFEGQTWVYLKFTIFARYKTWRPEQQDILE